MTDHLSVPPEEPHPIDTLQLSPAIQRLRFRECVLRDSELDFQPRRSSVIEHPFLGIEEIVWTNGELMDLSFLQLFPSLRQLDILDEGRIRSLEGVERVPDGCEVRLEGTRWNMDAGPVRSLAARGTCQVYYEPEYYFEDGQAVS